MPVRHGGSFRHPKPEPVAPEPAKADPTSGDPAAQTDTASLPPKPRRPRRGASTKD